MEVFVEGSWMFPYIVMVPLNTILSGMLLYYMFGSTIVVCYLGMIALVVI